MAPGLVRRLVIGAVIVLVGINFAGAFVLLWLRGSLPQLDGEVSGLPGLSAATLIERGADGTVTIRATTPEDASFALGYAHAQDRLWQMEMMRRIGSGRVAELIGEAGLGYDKLLRTLGLHRLAEANFHRLSPAAKRHVESYVAGVNAQLTHRSGPLPPEFLLAGIEPEPWTPADSLVWGRLMSLELAGNWFAEITRARMLKAGLTPAQIDVLYTPFDPAADVPTAPDRAAIEEISDRQLAGLKAVVPPELHPHLASNAWALSGDRSDTANPILAGDPHLGFHSPNTWWLARVEAPGYLRVGAFVPGVPFLVIGHNGSVAWSFTTTTSDTEDLFVERVDPEDPGRYVTPDGSAPFTTRVERFVVDGGTVEHVVRATRHGPVVSDALPSAAQAAYQGTVLAFSSPLLADDDGTAQALFDVASASDADEVLAALHGFHSPQQNVVFADTAGRIAMVSAGRVPIRRSGDGFYPSPGWTGTHDWTGWAPFRALPAAIDPAGGLVVNANNRVVGRDPTLFLGREFDAPYRAQRIVDLIAAGANSVDEMAAVQMDAISPFARDLLPILLPLLGEVSGEGVEPKAEALLRNWDGTMAVDQAAPLVFAGWVRALQARLFNDELGDLASDYRRARAATLKAVLTGETGWCDDVNTPTEETCSDAVRGAFADATALIVRLQGSDVARWQWGESHRATFSHRVWSRIPLLGHVLTMRTPTAGGDYTVSRGTFGGGDADPFRHNHGAGLRVIYDLANLDHSRFIAALGPSGNALSPMSTTWQERWARNEGLHLTAKGEPKHSLGLIP